MKAFQYSDIFCRFFDDSSLRIFADVAWGSSNPHYRLSVRAALAIQLRILNDDTPDSEILDLSHPPKSKSFGISISHCPISGGFAVSGKFKNIGWDIEQADRISEKVANRILESSGSEKPPLPAALWSAQEASFKALSGIKNLTHFTQATVSKWEPISESVYSYQTHYSEGKLTVPGKGLVFLNSNLVYSLLVLQQ